MAQVTRAVAQGILDGQGYTDNEVRQLAFHWLRSTSNAAGGAPTDEENEVSRQAFNLWYAIRHPKPTHENPTWAHARKCDDYEVWRAASGAYLRRIAELEAELVAEAKKTASEQLRADQMTEQHRMQAKMHKAAADALGKVLSAVQRYLPPDGPSDWETLNEIIGIVDPWPIPLDSSEPEPAATPWYPDDSGEWVEVPEDLMEMPAELSNGDLIQCLLSADRAEEYGGKLIGRAGSWSWHFHASDAGRIVAYKVVK